MEKKEYIERGAFDTELQNLVREYNRNCESDKSSGAFEALYRLRLFPAADVVEVVRCRECRYRQDRLYCRRLKEHPFIVTNTDFCSYGERKEE